MPLALIQAVISAPWVLWGSQESLPKLMEKFLIFPSKPFLAGGSSLSEPKNQPMHIEATYGTCDEWNYALEWHQVVLGCLRLHKNVFPKIAAVSEVNFSHRPKINLLWVGPKMNPFSSITIGTACVLWFWRLYDH